jgi:hypothetical protein
MVYWLSKKSVLEKIVRGNQNICIIRLICTTFCSGICYNGYHISLESVLNAISSQSLYRYFSNFLCGLGSYIHPISVDFVATDYNGRVSDKPRRLPRHQRAQAHNSTQYRRQLNFMYWLCSKQNCLLCAYECDFADNYKITIVYTGLTTKTYVIVLSVLNLVSDFVKCNRPIHPPPHSSVVSFRK